MLDAGTGGSALIDAIEITTHAGLRDRALIGLTVFSFARIGVPLGMKVEATILPCQGRSLAVWAVRWAEDLLSRKQLIFRYLQWCLVEPRELNH